MKPFTLFQEPLLDKTTETDIYAAGICCPSEVPVIHKILESLPGEKVSFRAFNKSCFRSDVGSGNRFDKERSCRAQRCKNISSRVDFGSQWSRPASFDRET